MSSALPQTPRESQPAESVTISSQATDYYDSLRQISAFHRFHFRLTLVYGGLMVVLITALVSAFYALWSESELSGMQQRLLVLASSLAQSIDGDAVTAVPLTATAVTEFHQKLQHQFKQVAAQDPDISSIYVLKPSSIPTQLHFLVDHVQDGDGATPGQTYSAEDLPVMLKGFARPAAEDKPYRDEFGLTLSAYAPIHDSSGSAVAIIGLDVRASRLAALQQKVFVSSFIGLLLAVLAVGALSWWVARSIREPLARLIHATNAVARGDFEVRMALQRKDEFGLLGERFDQMADDLKERQALRDLFGRYLSEDVARSVLQDPSALDLAGREMVVTVLFCDLKDYTSISEKLSPLQMVKMLNEYLEQMNRIIDEHGGCLIEFLGDGLLAVFGAPQHQPDHAAAAVRCALVMRDGLAQLNACWEEAGLAQWWQCDATPCIEFRIGLHSGAVVAGNMGSPQRTKYAVIGDTVNVAARLEEANKELGTTILMSEDTVSRLPQALADQTTRVGKRIVKGRQQAVDAYSI